MGSSLKLNHLGAEHFAAVGGDPIRKEEIFVNTHIFPCPKVFKLKAAVAGFVKAYGCEGQESASAAILKVEHTNGDISVGQMAHPNIGIGA